MSAKTVKEMVEYYLLAWNYDGLYGCDCGCETGDLMPCEGCSPGTDISQCRAGYKTKCDPDTCPADGDCPWHIGEEKQQ